MLAWSLKLASNMLGENHYFPNELQLHEPIKINKIVWIIYTPPFHELLSICVTVQDLLKPYWRLIITKLINYKINLKNLIYTL